MIFAFAEASFATALGVIDGLSAPCDVQCKNKSNGGHFLCSRSRTQFGKFVLN